MVNAIKMKKDGGEREKVRDVRQTGFLSLEYQVEGDRKKDRLWWSEFNTQHPQQTREYKDFFGVCMGQRATVQLEYFQDPQFKLFSFVIHYITI